MKDTILILKALSDKNRLKIVYSLFYHKELCACQITELLDVKGATASRHLSQLVTAGILDSRKDGRWVYYYLNKKFISNENEDLLNWLKNQSEASSEFEKDYLKLEKILSVDPEIICRKQRGEIYETIS